MFSILQNAHSELKLKFAVMLNGAERLLGILNTYRKKTLDLEEEHEAIVNIINILCDLML